ncbi:hypothetical protein HDU86_001890 [Geranomyces michiganensis]|nr:hypothetical protein HDU86_001890 [Geranomyces michiganensis]
MPLIAKVVSVAGLHDEDDVGSNDVYVKLSADGSTWQSTTCKNGAGKNAVFDESFQFDVPAGAGKLKVEVYDKDPGKDDLLGSASIDLSNYQQGTGEQDAVVTLTKHIIHRNAGVVNLRLAFV